MWKNILLTRVFHSDAESFTSSFGIQFRRFINPVFRRILWLASGHRIHLETYPKLEKGTPYIFVSTHSFVEDIITNLACIDRSAYMLIGSRDHVEHNPLLYAAWLNGMVFVDKTNPDNRRASVDKMARVLENRSSVVLFPEGSWNNTENLLVQPLFAGPWLLAQRTKCKVVPIAMFHEFKSRDIYVKVGEPLELAELEKREALDMLRDSMATMFYDLMCAHSTKLKREDLGSDPRLDFMEKRKNEYLRLKWTRDDFGMEITCYRDHTLPPTPQQVRASFDNVVITPENAAILAPILLRREEDKKYDFVQYMHENWKK